MVVHTILHTRYLHPQGALAHRHHGRDAAGLRHAAGVLPHPGHLESAGERRVPDDAARQLGKRRHPIRGNRNGPGLGGNTVIHMTVVQTKKFRRQKCVFLRLSQSLVQPPLNVESDWSRKTVMNCVDVVEEAWIKFRQSLDRSLPRQQKGLRLGRGGRQDVLRPAAGAGWLEILPRKLIVTTRC